MTLFLIDDALYWANRHQGYHGGYGLALPFLRGLLSGGFSDVVIGTELTDTAPSQFEKRLRAAFSVASDYVWIYGQGSAWQTGALYGKSEVAENFKQYLDVIHRVQASCAADG